MPTDCAESALKSPAPAGRWRRAASTGGTRIELAVTVAVAATAFWLVLYPLGWLVWGSFQGGAPGEGGTLTLDSYARVFLDPAYWDIVFRSVAIGIGATLLATAIGLPLAWLIVKTDMPGKRLAETLVLLPFFTSAFIGALAWTFLANPTNGLLKLWLGLPVNIYSMGGIVWVTGIYMAPYIYLFSAAALRNVDTTLEEASFMAGARLWRTLMRVSLPLIAPALLSGMSLVLVISMDIFGVAAILGFPARISLLATEVYVHAALVPPDYGRATVSGLTLIAITIGCLAAQHAYLRKRSYAVVGGRGFRTRVYELGRWTPVAVSAWIAYALVSVIAPLLVLIKNSLQIYPTPRFTAWTLDNWTSIFLTGNLRSTLIRSLYLSTFGATFCVIFTAVVAYIVYRSRMPGRQLLEQVSSIPIGIPGVVLGLGFMWAYITWPVWGTIWILVLAYMTLFMPYGVRAFGANLMQIHPELEESSRVHNATWLRTFVCIVLPLLRSGVYSTWILLFIIFVREISTAVLLTSVHTQVFPVLIFQQWVGGEFNRVSAGALLLSFIIFVVIALFRWGFRVDVVPRYR